ncbi:MAG TPA: methionyl-tRNA formyltransferase, partial [Saprospiraceae bacterium]|nr:methionyl-tRNA formyltransferase [Saprospiraceae bacterium]
MRIIFMGTPDFAVPSLEILLQHGYDIPAVVTAPDKPGGRLGMLESAVKKCAVAHGIPVLQPEKLKNPEFLA